MTLDIGHQLQQGRYQIHALLGRGGMGTVYLATDRNLSGRQVAIKENADTAPTTQEQFQHEAILLSRLTHANLPRVTDHFIEPSGRQYLVMDYVDGDDLRTLLHTHQGPLSEETVLVWLDQVFDALAYMHNWIDPLTRKPTPIIHRDIKPGNIKQTPNGRIVLVDFGVAKIDETTEATSVGAKAITPGYSPLEQYTGGTDARSDIYALGATLYTLLTGQRPPNAMARVSGTALPPPRQLNSQISHAMEQTIMRALSLAATDRFQHVEEMRAALPRRRAQNSSNPFNVQVGRAVSAAPTAQAATPPSPRKSRWSYWSTVAALVALVVLIVAVIAIPNSWLATWRPLSSSTPAASLTPQVQTSGLLSAAVLSTGDITATAPVTTLVQITATIAATPPALSPSAAVSATLVSAAVPLSTTIPTTVTATPLPAPTATASATPAPTATPSMTAQPTATAVPTATPSATAQPTATATATPLPTATATATEVPTATPSATVRPTETAISPPTAEPTASPTILPSPTAIPVAGDAIVHEPDGVRYHFIPAGPFTMGSTVSNDEMPVHVVTLDAFWMMETEVTNAQYRQCVEAGACAPPHNDSWQDEERINHPVTHIDWNQATAYASWVGGRLPTEAEWEKAARGTDERMFPWADTVTDSDHLNFNAQTTTAVGSFAAGVSPFGLLDMAGNVEEWVRDWYSPTYYDEGPSTNPPGPETGLFRVVRGGSFTSNRGMVRTTVRGRAVPDSTYATVGMRIVLPHPLQ
ncbi:MAG: SUMF1/EgtB/PvdO family nonheme iron enzyme [Caldilineaceae bacterium]